MSNLSMLENDPLIISGRTFSSRLMLGTGKYQNFQEAKESILLSGCEILTVAVRRAQSSNVEGIDRLLNNLDWTKIWLMPNTAGCQTSEQSIRLAFLGRELLKNLNYIDNNFLKLEVISDPKYLLPDSLGTITAAEYLCNKNFDILPYINADPVLAKQLEDIGCATVMPLGSPIGSNQGLKNLYNIKILIVQIAQAGSPTHNPDVFVFTGRQINGAYKVGGNSSGAQLPLACRDFVDWAHVCIWHFLYTSRREKVHIWEE